MRSVAHLCFDIIPYQSASVDADPYVLQAILVDSNKIERIIEEAELECGQHGDREFDAEIVDADPRSTVRHGRDHLQVSRHEDCTLTLARRSIAGTFVVGPVASVQLPAHASFTALS